MAVDRRTLIELFTTMLTIGRFEERAAREFYHGDLFGFIHSDIGQEAIATGVCKNLSKADRIASPHRGHGHCIAKGADMRRRRSMMAEIYGKKTDERVTSLVRILRHDVETALVKTKLREALARVFGVSLVEAASEVSRHCLCSPDRVSEPPSRSERSLPADTPR